MFIADKPYVSDFFKKTIKDNSIPVVGTETALQMDFYDGSNIINENSAIDLLRSNKHPIIYANSENSIGWIAENLSFSDLPDKIDLFKDKVKFRNLTKSLFPDFFFKEVSFDKLRELDITDLPLPFIIKPAVGFFSMGVYKVANIAEWPGVLDLIFSEIDQVRGLYPEEVLNTNSFIIEEVIDGDEFAVDAYFDSNGNPVVLSILKHFFSSDEDFSDRVYISSKKIIEDNLEDFTEFAKNIGNLAGVRNFPVHIELRRDKQGLLLPIEVNPMRFGGWCTTADLSFFAYDFNPYLYYYNQEKPNWAELLKGKEGKLFSVIVLDNSSGKSADEIKSFNYDKLLLNFEKPIELRKVDYKNYPLFGFLFVETREENFIELKNILNSDLNEFIST